MMVLGSGCVLALGMSPHRSNQMLLIGHSSDLLDSPTPANMCGTKDDDNLRVTGAGWEHDRVEL